MSAIRKSLWPAVLTLVLTLGIAGPASGQGIWTYEYRTDGVCGHTADNVTLSIVNLTERKLVVKSPAPGTSFSTYCAQHSTDYVCKSFASYPFEADLSTLYDNPDFQAQSGTLYIYPYRTATWASHTIQFDAGDYAWIGKIAVYPQGTFGSAAGEQFTVYVNAARQNPTNDSPIVCPNKGKGTWWYLQAKDSSVWSPAAANYFEGIYITPVVDSSSSSKYNVMTMTGPFLTASLIAGANNHPVLVVREHLIASSNTLDQSQTATWIYRPSFGSGVYINGYNSSRMAQIVTAGQSGILDQVSVYIDSSYITGPVTVSIQTVSNGLPSGITIGSGTIPADALPPGASWAPNPQWVSTKVSANGGASLAMTPGTQYALVLSAGGNQITWYGSGNVYSGGYVVYDYSSGWGGVTNSDAMFQTYVTPDIYNQYMGWRLDFVNQPNNSVPLPPP